MRRLLVTSALPYANGSIHIGHLVEYIQTDVWVRFQKLIGNDAVYVCADDTHGTPIMIRAKNEGITAETLIEGMRKEHMADFESFNIQFDHYHSTHSDENRQLSEDIFLKAQKKGLIYDKDIEQAYCEHDGMFLPDRFIKGTCPVCKSEDQYGDSCEKCSATYRPTELIDAQCTQCGSAPTQKKSNHYFFALSKMTDEVKTWVDGEAVRDEVKNKLNEWFESGIKDWDISRDAPYFGFKIPGTDDKYFYVWMDAPVGYMASTQKWCELNGKSFEDYWHSGDVEIHHFIGKDILYFHTLFWPAMLMASDYVLPSKINVHGFLTVDGEKMSKSRGTFILANDFVANVEPEFLRYYYCSKLTASIEDIDLSFEDFVNKVNSDVVNKIVNIGSRLGSILHKKCDGKITDLDEEGRALMTNIVQASETIKADYETLNFRQAVKGIVECAERINKYIDDKAPWSLVKENPVEAVQVCSAGLNGLWKLAIMLQPVMPQLCEKIRVFLNQQPSMWQALSRDITQQAIQPYEHLASRLDLDEVKKLKMETAETH